MIRTLAIAAIFAAAPAAAQLSTSPSTGAAGGTSGSLSTGTGTGAGTGLNSTAIGRPPAPLGSTSSLSERIDSAAGLSPVQRPGARSTLDRPTGSIGSGGGVSGVANSNLDDRLRPAGQPLGPTTTGQDTRTADPLVPRL
ncbi:hypothetical protein ABC347_15060 [Sphingomonas sp. 1P06PA]|uniref:hypothetical protein n=1 Tax=Sphingomonas sp. 1P06PA TaxID=554121 RepID=UPI0039A5B417